MLSLPGPASWVIIRSRIKMILKRTGLRILVLAMLLIGVVFAASASSNDSTTVTSEDEVSGIAESESQDIQIPDFSPQTFENLKNDPNILATKGQIPDYTNQVEKQSWIDKLDKSRVLLDNDTNMEPYMYPKGPIIGYAWNNQGYFEVMLYKNMKITDSQINEIYDVINKTANKASIKEIPIVFSKDDLFQDHVSGYNSYHRPIIGAIKVTGQTGGWGTIGFAAQTSSGTKGYVTVQHLGTSVGYKMYQPINTLGAYGAGSVSKISGHYADACFVPYSNVAAKIHIGGGSTKNVYGYDSTVPGISWNNRKVYKSGTTTGVTDGTIKGAGTLDNGPTYYNMVYSNYGSSSGDSGGPVYRIINGNYYLLGIHKGYFHGYSWFSPVSGIKSDLGVTPIKS